MPSIQGRTVIFDTLLAEPSIFHCDLIFFTELSTQQIPLLEQARIFEKLSISAQPQFLEMGGDIRLWHKDGKLTLTLDCVKRWSANAFLSAELLQLATCKGSWSAKPVLKLKERKQGLFVFK